MLSFSSGPHCAARPYQVYLLSGIARWNADRSSSAVFGQQGQRHLQYSSSLIQRLNMRCRTLFGDDHMVERNFRPPAVPSSELLGLEYLFDQSTASSPDAVDSMDDLLADGAVEDEEAEEVTDEISATVNDDGYDSDSGDGSAMEVVDMSHINMTTNETAEELEPCAVCLFIIYLKNLPILRINCGMAKSLAQARACASDLAIPQLIIELVQ